MRTFKLFSIGLLLFISQISFAALTDISNLPLVNSNNVKPNVIFAIDDSGSMDFEILLNTSDGQLWWDSAADSFTSGGTPLFNSSGSAGTDGIHTWYGYAYLFPNGTNADARLYSDTYYGYYAVPPIPEYAFMRSSDYNAMYYNPATTYLPWESAYVSGSLLTFSNSTPSAAKSHPLYNNTLINLTNGIDSSSSNWKTTNWNFRMQPGMVIPGATISGIQARPVTFGFYYGSWKAINTNYSIPDGETWDVAIPYYPATYYVKDTTCTSGYPTCATAPDGNKLRRYEIRNGNTFPSGRSYTDEMQNFANWFTYYRKRELLMSASMGTVLTQVNSVRGGVVRFNNLSPVTMYDFDSASSSANGKAVLGFIYPRPAANGTPTRDALKYVGNQYMTNNNIIQYACQYNSAMVVTDGYANITATTSPSYSSTAWGSSAPYTTTYANTLADLALAYYTLNLRPSFATGKVPLNPNDTSPNADKNTNLHMNTYALSIGVLGTIYGTGSPQATDPFTNPPAWPNPTIDYSPAALDDLWHATINGRGAMFTATNSSNFISYLNSLIEQIFLKSGSSAAVSVPTVNISSGNNTVYVSSYSGKAGDLQNYFIDLTTGVVSTGASTWSAQALLDQRTANDRAIATYSGSAGVAFQWGSIGSTYQSLLNSPSASDGQNVLAWLRGDRSKEGTTYRVRSHLLGDIIGSEAVPVSSAIASYNDVNYGNFASAIASRTPMVYQGANDGMLHAFNAATGQETWAYIPSPLASTLDSLTSKTYNHLYYVNATPTVGDVATSSNVWSTILVGGLGAGGKGYYALNITNPAAANDTDVAAKVLWEFPNSATSSSVRANIGLTFGKPIIAKTKAAGWVVLVTSGYNNSTGDGKGHLFVLNPATGAVIADLVTSVGSATTPSGLAQISAFASNQLYDATIDYVYGGDLQGNLWRFDLSGATTTAWNAKLLATLINSSSQAQPITTAPELLEINGRRMVYVGTGQLLGNTDLSTTQKQSMYGLVDNKTSTPTISPLRSNLLQKTISGTSISNTAVNYATYKGWYFDFPNNSERVTADPIVAKNLLVFNTNMPSATACASTSFQYIVDPSTGGQVAGVTYNGVATSIIPLAATFTTKPVIVVLPNGELKSISHNINNTVSTISLPSASVTGTTKKIGWKEIFRR